MILEAKTVIPFIHFGFNTISKVSSTGVVVDVYLNTIYNQDVYKFFTLESDTATTIVNISNYHYQISYNSVGVKEISLKIEIVKEEPNPLISNILSIDIQSRSFDSDTVGFDNTELTFDIF